MHTSVCLCVCMYVCVGGQCAWPHKYLVLWGLHSGQKWRLVCMCNVYMSVALMSGQRVCTNVCVYVRAVLKKLLGKCNELSYQLLYFIPFHKFFIPLQQNCRHLPKDWYMISLSYEVFLLATHTGPCMAVASYSYVLLYWSLAVVFQAWALEMLVKILQALLDP